MRSESCMSGNILVRKNLNCTLVLQEVSCSSKRASTLSCSLRDLSALYSRTPTDDLELALDFDLKIEELEDVGISRRQIAGCKD